MSSDLNRSFTKENLDLYLKEVAKEYRKLGGKNAPAEIVLIGGAAILAGYEFRETTTDVDALMNAMSSIKEAINSVGDKFNLPSGWLNEDFKRTASYSTKLVQYSIHYKSFYGVLFVRRISAEYLIAMKLKSCREYKKDISDIVGVLAEHEVKGIPVSKEKIQNAIVDLYESLDAISDKSKQLLDELLDNGNYMKVYSDVISAEEEARQLLISFEDSYPSVLNHNNVDEIMDVLKSHLKKTDNQPEFQPGGEEKSNIILPDDQYNNDYDK